MMIDVPSAAGGIVPALLGSDMTCKDLLLILCARMGYNP